MVLTREGGETQAQASQTAATRATPGTQALQILSPERPPSLEPYVVSEPERPLRILMVGDSVGMTLQGSVDAATRLLSEDGQPAVVTRYWNVPGFGFTSDHEGILDWDGAKAEATVPPGSSYSSWQEDLLEWTVEDDPDIVLVVVGAWDAIPREDGGRWFTPGTAEWRRWYLDIVDRTNRALGATGALVTYLRFPCIRSELQSERIEMVNSVIEDAASLRPGKVTVLPLDAVACPNGDYLQSYRAPDEAIERQLRMTDGVHFDFFGAVPHLSPWLAEELDALAGPAR